MDLIERSAVLHDLESLWDYSTVDGITASTVLKQVKTDVRNAPAVDAVPVVRCKECKHLHIDGVMWTCVFGLPSGADGYCSYGKRKDGKDETDGTD